MRQTPMVIMTNENSERHFIIADWSTKSSNKIAKNNER